jgi:hypothetical protein
MISVTQKDDIYTLRVESNSKLIGYFKQSPDSGLHNFEAYSTAVLLDDYVLFEIATKLREINQPFRDFLDNWEEED